MTTITSKKKAPDVIDLTSDSDDAETAEEPTNKRTKTNKNECNKRNRSMYFLELTEDLTEQDLKNDKHLYFIDKSSIEDKPQIKITNFSVFDEDENICDLDSEEIENGFHVFIVGVAEPIFNIDLVYIDKYKIGPLENWWIHGFYKKEQVAVGVSTEFADYYLSEPSEVYKNLFLKLLEKASYLKSVIELLQVDYFATLQNLLEKLKDETDVPVIKKLESYAQFIVKHVACYDNGSDEDEPRFMDTELIQTITTLSNAIITNTITSTKKSSRTNHGEQIMVKPLTTPLVYKILKSCDGFKGNITTNSCKKSKLNKTSILYNDDSDTGSSCELLHAATSSDDEDNGSNNRVQKKHIHWGDKPINWRNVRHPIHLKAFYNHLELKKNDFVELNTKCIEKIFSIAQIIYMFDGKVNSMIHVQLFRLASSTILGDSANELELVMIPDCRDLPINAIIDKCKVELRSPPPNWRKIGGIDLNETDQEDEIFFYQKFYDEQKLQFIDLPFMDSEELHNKCYSCYYKNNQKIGKTPRFDSNSEVLYWNDEIYEIGSCCFFVTPNNISATSNPQIHVTNDAEMFPESFRKNNARKNLPRPFQIGQIVKFLETEKLKSSNLKAQDVYIQFRMFYRPEDTSLNDQEIKDLDLNLVFWTKYDCQVCLTNVTGKCCVFYGRSSSNEGPSCDYFVERPHRFYFLEGYDKRNNQRIIVDDDVKKAFELNQKSSTSKNSCVTKKLVALDLYSGCGGLTTGFVKAGLIEPRWAVDHNESAANAYRLNYPNAKVLQMECSYFLELLLHKKQYGDDGNKLPSKNEVDIILGGPPCQGFSGLNRFNHNSKSLIQNSQIALFTSVVEYLRPNYFLMENVPNITTVNNGSMITGCISAFFAMDYQITWAVLQAGCYGVPQSRKRFFLIGTAPGLKLPSFPEPLHVLSECSLKMNINQNEYKNNLKWSMSAPFRTLTIYDAISDLPLIDNGQNKRLIKYENSPKAHYQKLLRKNVLRTNTVIDHICKPLQPLDMARISHITAGSDWRDLPNVVVQLSDGSYTNKLKYNMKLPKSVNCHKDMKRAVCPCEFDNEEQCTPQANTLIPWHLPHRASKNDNFKGAYGRLDWTDHFATIITDPKLGGRMGRLIHPEQNRILSVREFARAQGFHDEYKFSGTISDKHRQIGNSVPVLLAYTIALEFAECITGTKSKTF